MATMRFAVLIAVLLSAQVLFSDARKHIHHGHRARRQAVSPTGFDRFAKAIGLDTSQMSSACRAQFQEQNGKCLSAVKNCVSSSSASGCDKVAEACQAKCRPHASCSLAPSLGGVLASTLKGQVSPVHFCFPSSCRGTVFRQTLTAFTRAIYQKATTSLSHSNFFSSGTITLASVTTRCDTAQVSCRSSSSCSFQTLAAVKPTYATIHTRQPPTFRALTHRPKTRRPGLTTKSRSRGTRRPWTSRPKTANPRARPTVRTQRWHPNFPVTGHSQNPNFGSSSDSGSASDSFIPGQCGNCAAKGLTCCRIGDNDIGCCPDAVSDFVYGVIDRPLDSLSPYCKSSLIREKATCFDEYIECLDEISSSLSKLDDESGLSDQAKIAILPTLLPKMQACARVRVCLVSSQGGKKCPASKTCMATTTSSSVFGVDLGGGQDKYNVCLPLDCQSQSDIWQLASFLFDTTCGPFCIAEQLLEPLHLTNFLPTCPIVDLKLSCRSRITGRPITATHYEEQKSDVCEAAMDIAKKFSHGSLDGGKDILNYVRHRGNNDDKDKKEWSNPWLIVGIACAGLTFLVAVVLLVRWNIVARRRRAQANVYTYAHLTDESVTPDVPGVAGH